MAKREADLALAVRIYKVLLDLHLGIMPQHPFDHGGDLRAGAGLELRVDAHGVALDMVVDHHTRTAIPRVPLCHQVLVPRAKALTVRGAGRRPFSPQVDLSYPKDRIA